MTFPPLPCRLASLALLGLGLSSLTGFGAEKVSFNRDIRPIFSDTCFQCHGPDEAKRKAGLRLDIRADALKPAKSGEIAIVPGKPDESEVIKRLTATDPEDLMPPEKLHKQISPAQIATVKRWIAEGAEYQGHWAFIAPQRLTAPVVADPSAVRNPIDAFVQARLAREGLKPSPEADKATLIRRVSLDLTGIPPTPKEVDAFLADTSPRAYEAMVDRLLASPRYGERMAIQWLDFARYADSNGFQSDTSRQMWHWRDWVIEAFNRNEPFDQFTIDQLAGDLVPNAQRDQIIATGFNRNLRLNGEGGRIVEEWAAETVIDRVDTTGATWLGLTLGCCRCHDHKFDPITQKDFYQLFAFFNSVDETGVLQDYGGAAGTRQGGNTMPLLSIPTPAQKVEEGKLQAEVRAAEARVAAAEKLLPNLQRAWETQFAQEMEQKTSAWEPLTPSQLKSEGGATFTRQDDGSYLVGGPSAKHDVYTISMPLAEGVFTGLRIEALPDASLPKKNLGRSGGGDFVLTGLEAEITSSKLPQQLVVEFTRAETDYQQKEFDVKMMLDANAPLSTPLKGTKAGIRKGWAVSGFDPSKGQPAKAMFVANAPVKVPADATLIVRLKQESNYDGHNIGRFRLASTSLLPKLVKMEGGGVPEAVRGALRLEPAARTPAQRETLVKFYRENTDNPATRAAAEATEVKKKLADLTREFPNTMVMKELAEPRPAFILKRGEYDHKGEPVQRGLPAALPPMPAGAPMNRLGLAQWIASADNPLTARVWVNRAWERFFGLGLVRTSENFGSQAEWPSHPELLDWLATEFVRLKWDMKALQKEILLSATYRQSSRVTPELVERDPENRLLARGPRFRLSAELIRDQALAVSGLLVEKVGGPSVKPYMPANVWDETSKYGDMRGYKEDAGEGLYRRSLYTIWKRTAAPPSMSIFDSPSREICTVKRSRTNTPLQALSLLNEVTYVEAARVLAQRMIAEGGAGAAERIAWAFKKVTARPPLPEELCVLQNGLEKRVAKFTADGDAAQKLVSLGASKPDAKSNPGELAAYTVTANVLLNLDEVVTRE